MAGELRGARHHVEMGVQSLRKLWGLFFVYILTLFTHFLVQRTQHSMSSSVTHNNHYQSFLCSVTLRVGDAHGSAYGAGGLFVGCEAKMRLRTDNNALDHIGKGWWRWRWAKAIQVAFLKFGGYFMTCVLPLGRGAILPGFLPSSDHPPTTRHDNQRPATVTTQPP